MKSISNCLLPCIALVGIVYSCTTKDNLPTFKEVFPEILAVVDSPKVLTKKQSLGNGKLQMLCYNKWKEDYEPMAFIVFGKNVKVQAVKNKYNYIAIDSCAFAVRISMFMDPVVNFDFKNKKNAEEYYRQIYKYGLLEDNYKCLYVTEKRQKPGITHIKDFSGYKRTICVQKPTKLPNGWYTITLGN